MGSQILHLSMTAPINSKIEARALETVATLLRRVATVLDIGQRHAGCLDLVFSDQRVEDRELSLGERTV